MDKRNRKAMDKNWSNQKSNPALKTKMGKQLQIDKRQWEHVAYRAGSYFPKGGHSATQTDIKVRVMNKHKVKHHRKSDSKTGNRDHIRTTALERSVINYWWALTMFSPATSPSVTDVVQTFSWLFGSHDKPLTRQRIFTVRK